MAQRFDGKQRWLTALWACASIWLAAVSVARADEASGKWTGEVTTHGNYYLEKSTRVVVPMGRVDLEAPNGVRVNAQYLADVITSASIASGTGDSDAAHTELRNAVTLGTGKSFAVGDNDLDLSAYAIHSWEPDYLSWIGGLRANYGFNQKNTIAMLGIVGVHDSVYMNQGTTRNFVGHLDGVTFNFGFSQLLSPTMIFNAGYQLVYLSGFLGNPYRAPKKGPLRYMENPPDSRLRHNLEASLSWYLPGSQTTLQPFFRVYTDSWKLSAITPELRVYQQLGRDFNLRLRGRYYLQSKADFAQRASMIGVYPAGFSGNITDDPKLTEFDSVQLGARISWWLTAFQGTFLGWARNAVLDLSFDHTWTTIASNSFGKRNFFIILGGRIPF